MSPYELKLVIDEHKKWLSDPDTGQRADLSNANLHGANLHGANLRNANLHDANLHDADLHCADLHCADLRNANLHKADLRNANLYSADLRNANLQDANLCGANLLAASLPYPVYQFYLGKHYAVATPLQLRIGCQAHSWDIWLNDSWRKEIANKAGFSEQDYVNYTATISLFHGILINKEGIKYESL